MVKGGGGDRDARHVSTDHLRLAGSLSGHGVDLPFFSSARLPVYLSACLPWRCLVAVSYDVLVTVSYRQTVSYSGSCQ